MTDFTIKPTDVTRRMSHAFFAKGATQLKRAAKKGATTISKTVSSTPPKSLYMFICREVEQIAKTRLLSPRFVGVSAARPRFRRSSILTHQYFFLKQHHSAWLGETDDGNLKELLLPY